jgi:dimeric dUTPase (all-alpha-NTP-PPase superfamily)
MHNRDLEELYINQHGFNKMISADAFGDLEQRTTYVRDMTLAAMIELGEALNEWKWKPWATGRGVDRDAYLGELADVMCFLLNLAIAGKISAQELYDATAAKQKINVDRQRAGYAG